MPADHVAHMQLRELVVAQVQHAVAVLGKARDDLLGLVGAARQCHADKNLRALRGEIAVIELRDIARAQRLAELEEGAAPLGNLYG